TLAGPVARLEPVLRQLRLARSGLWVVVVPPPRLRRQRHQDRLDAAAGLQAEDRAAVVDEVELDVAAAAVLLELLLRLRIRLVLAAAGDGGVGVEEGVAGATDEGEGLLQVAF